MLDTAQVLLFCVRGRLALWRCVKRAYIPSKRFRVGAARSRLLDKCPEVMFSSDAGDGAQTDSLVFLVVEVLPGVKTRFLVF